MSDKVQPLTQNSENFLIGGSEMGALIRAKDWSKTSLGPVERWPHSLRTTVSICLASDLPICIIWGPDLVQIYNDGYRVICGGKHPHSMGQNFAECWREAWPVIGDTHDSALAGDTAFLENQRIFLERHGYVEESFFTFSFSPIRDESGHVVGLFHPVIEMTAKMLGERRTRALRDVAARTANAKTVQEACALAAQSLAGQELDVPFALIYVFDETDSSARLIASSGIPDTVEGNPISSGRLQSWPLAELPAQRHGEVVEQFSTRFGNLRCGPYPESPRAAVVLPLVLPGAERPVGLLIAGVSGRLKLNQAYRDFYELLGATVATAVANGRAFEEERKRAEALAELDRAKTAFFSNVSHEFRTPLTLMLGPVEELLSRSHTDLSPSTKGQLELVNRNGLRLLRLVNSLLDFSRIEADRMQATYEATDLATLTAELASCFQSATEQAGLHLIVDCPPLSEPVYVDRDMWEKIVLNLLSNAFKFTLNGEIAVRLQTVDGHACLTVRDTGVGIPAEELPRMFERFHRIEYSRGRTHEGTGIGLALVQELVKLHGGVVRVDSIFGEGSTFTVTIPFGMAHLPADRIGSPRRQASTARGVTPFVEEALRWLPDNNSAELSDQTGSESYTHYSGLSTQNSRQRVLLADDNADMREYVTRLLKDRYEVVAVADGQAGLEAARANPPDLVLTDVMMPRLDGFGLLRALRDNPMTKTIPVILLSARAGEESRVDGLEHGADDYLIKPFSARELSARVQAHLDMARLRRESESALRESEARFRKMADTAPAMLWVTEQDCSCSFLSRGWHEFTGQNDEEGLGTHAMGWLEAVHPEDRERSGRVFLDANEKRCPFSLEYRLRRHDGDYRWAIDMGRPRFGPNGEFLGYIGSVLDITERKALEERLRSFTEELEAQVEDRTRDLMQSQDRLRALTTDLNLAELRERKRLATELHDHLQQILVLGKLKLGQGKRLAEAAPAVARLMNETDDVLSDALKYTRTLVTELSPPVLRDHGLPAGLKWLGEYMQKHDVSVAVTVPDEELELSEEQLILLFQSVRELLINSAKHAGTGQAAVRMEQHDGHLRIEVRDEGAGFDIAAAGAAGTSGGGISSKFGLFSIRERMRVLGGAFDLRSFPGQGTTATLTMPFQHAIEAIMPTAEHLQSASAIGHSLPTALSQKIRVLLVDDHVMVRQGLRAVLDAYADVELVGEVSNGEEAVRFVDKLRPTVVVMDINMPKMDGIEATAYIKEYYPKTIVIGLSVNAAKENEEAMKRAGAVRLMTKESAVEQLYDAIQEAVNAETTR